MTGFLVLRCLLRDFPFVKADLSWYIFIYIVVWIDEGSKSWIIIEVWQFTLLRRGLVFLRITKWTIPLSLFLRDSLFLTKIFLYIILIFTRCSFDSLFHWVESEVDLSSRILYIVYIIFEFFERLRGLRGQSLEPKCWKESLKVFDEEKEKKVGQLCSL